MAARTRQPNHDERARAKIRSSQLINRLIAFVDGTVELSGAQVTAALGLIRKTLPDLRHVELTGPGGGPLQVDDARQRNLALVDDIADRAAGAADPDAAAGGAEPVDPGGAAGLPVGVAELVGAG